MVAGPIHPVRLIWIGCGCWLSCYFPFHSAAVFYEGELGRFYVADAQSSAGLSVFIEFVHQWTCLCSSFWPVRPARIRCRHAPRWPICVNGCGGSWCPC